MSIKNSRFVDNGVDVFCVGNTTAEIVDNTCLNHLAGFYTPYSAIWSEKSDVRIRHNSFEGYYYTLYCTEMNDILIEENTFGLNAIGIYIIESQNGEIKSNFMNQGYVAIYYYRTSININNNFFLNHQAGIGCDEESNPIISNNTIVLLEDNKEVSYGIGCAEGASPIIYNTIVKGYELNLYIFDPNTHPTITYSFIQSDTLPAGCIDGGHNILGSTLDPMFVDEENNNCQLQPNSPCINAGCNNAPDLSDTDILGNPRISGPAVDIGAYEYQWGK